MLSVVELTGRSRVPISFCGRELVEVPLMFLAVDPSSLKLSKFRAVSDNAWESSVLVSALEIPRVLIATIAPFQPVCAEVAG